MTSTGRHPRRLRLAALNIDGVLLPDSFSPVIHRFVTSRGGAYTAELEYRVFSQERGAAARALADALPGELSAQDVVTEYFRERDAYLAAHPLAPTPGALDLVRRCRAYGLRTVAYGGLGGDHFDRELGEHAALFDEPGYVCTNDMRPGLREIAELFGLAPDQVLFVDDVARVAQTAKGLNAPFIGHPSTLPHSHQAARMRKLGVRHIVSSLDEIDEEMIRAVDREAETGAHWTSAPRIALRVKPKQNAVNSDAPVM